MTRRKWEALSLNSGDCGDCGGGEETGIRK
jgi:hypothetical protein